MQWRGLVCVGQRVDGVFDQVWEFIVVTVSLRGFALDLVVRGPGGVADGVCLHGGEPDVGGLIVNRRLGNLPRVFRVTRVPIEIGFLRGLE